MVKKKKKIKGTEGVHQTSDKQEGCETILSSVKITVGPEQRGEAHPPEKVDIIVSEYSEKEERWLDIPSGEKKKLLFKQTQFL